MSKLFQVYEEDLVSLERTMPLLVDALGVAINRPEVHVMAEQVKEILSNVRWNYGPPTELMVIPMNKPDPE